MSNRPSTTLDRPRRSRPSGGSGRGSDRSGTFNLKQLSEMTGEQLARVAQTLEIAAPEEENAQDLSFQILKAQAERLGHLFFEGVLEVLPDGYGFLRSPENDYLQGAEDVYVPPNLIRLFNMRTGDTLSGQVRSPKPDERYFTLVRVEAVNFLPPEKSRARTHFDNLTPIYPDRMLRMETEPQNLSGRVLDLFVPIGVGQRGLIVAPPRTGKTMLLQAIAAGIAANHPDAYL
ncbi:MAG: transcription termination factor Rho, partial [Acidobacteriota bacterium]